MGARLAAAFAILAAALLVVGLVGVDASRSLNLSSTSSAQSQRFDAQALISALGLNAQASAHEVVRHLYVYDGDLQNEDVIAWRVGQRKAQMLGELRRTKPQVADPRAVKALARLTAGATPTSPPPTRPSASRARRRCATPAATPAAPPRAPPTSARSRRPSTSSRPAARRSRASWTPRTARHSPQPRPRRAAASAPSGSSSPSRLRSPRSWPSSSRARSRGRSPSSSSACAASPACA